MRYYSALKRNEVCVHYDMCVCVCVPSRSVMFDSLRPHGLYPTRLLCQWNFPGKNTGVGCHFLLQGIFPTQGSNLGLLHLLHWQASGASWETRVCVCFNWSIVTLQCHVSFCCATVWISYMDIYIPFPLELHPPHPIPEHLGHHRAPSWASRGI